MSTLTHFFKLFKYSFSDKYFWDRKREETEKQEEKEKREEKENETETETTDHK